MRDDYLWDRSGEPDPETERLERTLQGLRHQPRPLELPVMRPRRQLFHGLAAAAAIVLMVLAGGMWLALRRSADEAVHRLVIVRPTPDSLVGLYRMADSFTLKEVYIGSRAPNAESTQMPRAKGPRHMIEERQPASAFFLAKWPMRRHDEEMMREGERAKEQLMLALHFASSKLNLVQRKIQVNKESGPAS
jgi:hypothetical protein